MQLDRTSFIVLAGIVFIVTALSLVAWQLRSQTAETSQNQAHSLSVLSKGSYIDRSGTSVSLSAYAGAPLLVLSWASWAPGSDTALRTMDELNARYHEQDLGLVAVNRGEQQPVVESYIAFAAIDPQIPILLDPDDYFFRTNESYDMPAIYLFDRTGARVGFWRAGGSTAEIETALAGIGIETQ